MVALLCLPAGLQFPPVPESSGLLASIENVTNEDAVGASIFRNAELVFQFQKAMRFTDARLVEILEVMRAPEGRPLRDELWKVLEQIELSVAQPDLQPGWYHSSYCWSVSPQFVQCLWRANRQYGIGDLWCTFS